MKVKVIGQRSRSLAQKCFSELPIVYETEYVRHHNYMNGRATTWVFSKRMRFFHIILSLGTTIPCLLSVCFDDAILGRCASFYVNKPTRVNFSGGGHTCHRMMLYMYMCKFYGYNPIYAAVL